MPAAPPAACAAPTATAPAPAWPRSRSPSGRARGNYWNGTGFSSATEVWNNATIAAGDWEYALASSDFPADGGYTVRVRARDAAGNTETASSRTFDFDATEPETTIDSSQPDPTQLAERDLRLLVERARLDLRVQHRRRRLDGLHEPRELPRPLRRQPQLRRARHRPAGNTDGNPATVFWTVDTTAPSSRRRRFPTAGEQLHDRRVERRLLRRPVSAAPTATARAPASSRSRSPSAQGTRRLLGRQRLHERLRGLERRDDRRRRLGAGLRRRRLPG